MSINIGYVKMPYSVIQDNTSGTVMCAWNRVRGYRNSTPFVMQSGSTAGTGSSGQARNNDLSIP